MTGGTPSCREDLRRPAVRAHRLNGLDYLEVSDDQRTLTVYFLGKAPTSLEAANVRIDGGLRIKDISVTRVHVHRSSDPEVDDHLDVTVDRPGDFSPYTLRMVEASHGRPGDSPMRGFDPRYAQLEFTFKAGCPSDMDCLPEAPCPTPLFDEPDIDYLAKDYASLRRLVLDRLGLLVPDWTERHAADLGIVLAELLAYVGDYLSYYQDAVATEAYLNTARRRISIRRHARLVDYRVSEGCNARAWVAVEVNDPLSVPASRAFFVAGLSEIPVSGMVAPADLDHAAGAYEVFEPLLPGPDGRLEFFPGLNRIPFYTWGEDQCCLPSGATSATLADGLPEPVGDEGGPGGEVRDDRGARGDGAAQVGAPEGPLAGLAAGQILLFEEVLGPNTGEPADADLAHRHAVRLTRVTPGLDEVFGQPVVQIEWDPEDALPFPLCLSSLDRDCRPLRDVSVARGNVVLVDHGATTGPVDFGTAAGEDAPAGCDPTCPPLDPEARPGSLEPPLIPPSLTFADPLPPRPSACRAHARDPRSAIPQVGLSSTSAGSVAGGADRWGPQPDLLESGPTDRTFVVEMDDDGYGHVRLGDGVSGRAPDPGASFRATYRLGNGSGGNVGAEAISALGLRGETVDGVMVTVRNPLPARGGADPEPVAVVKVMAPQAFRRTLERAVTAEDYAQLAGRAGGLQGASGELRWTGSWYEARVAVDPCGSETASPGLLRSVASVLAGYRRVGHDLAVRPASYAPLDVGFIVCVLPGYFRGHVEADLLRVLGDGVLPDGRRGLFHPDSLRFGQDVHASDLIAVTQAVDGVESVELTKLERRFEGPAGELAAGVLRLGPHEIAQLDNDPNFPERGRLALDMRGGR